MPGSVIATAVISSPAQMPGSQRRFCSSFVRCEEVRQADVVVQRDAEAGGVDVGALQLLGDHDVEAEVGDPPAAVLLGHVHAEEPVGPGRREQRRGRRCPPPPSARGAGPSPARRTWRTRRGTARGCRRTGRAPHDGTLRRVRIVRCEPAASGLYAFGQSATRGPRNHVPASRRSRNHGRPAAGAQDGRAGRPPTCASRSSAASSAKASRSRPRRRSPSSSGCPGRRCARRSGCSRRSS